MNSMDMRILDVASDAGYYGSLTRDAIRKGFSEETVILFAIIAIRYAKLAIEFSEKK